MGRKSRSIPEINAGSMADIAFLLLIFFLVTAEISSDAGLQVRLPPPPDPRNKDVKSQLKERDVLEVLINSNNVLLVEGKHLNIKELTGLLKKHLMNEGRDPDLAISSQKAIVSLQNARGTSYDTYIQVYNELMRGYNEVRNEAALAKYGRPYPELLKKEKETIRDKYPMKISEAEPVKIGE
jgi:biopolymer transport protein ExbD